MLYFPGYTALHTAVNWGKLDCIEELVNAGADVNSKVNFRFSL